MTNKEEFETRWADHINDLYGMGFNLSMDDNKKLSRIIKGLRELAVKAIENKFKNDCIHCGAILEMSDYGQMVCVSCEEPQYQMV